MVPLVKTEVKNSHVTIFTEQSISPKKTIQITMKTEMLKKLSLAGANNVAISGIKGETFENELNGAGNIDYLGNPKKGNPTYTVSEKSTNENKMKLKNQTKGAK